MNDQEFKNENDKLYREWTNLKNESDTFVWDGIIDYHNWHNYDLKLLFFAKEAYCDENTLEWDYTEEFRESKGNLSPKKSKPFFNRLREWTYTIDAAMHGKATINPQDFISNQAKCSELILSSAIINLKKINGKSSSSDKELRQITIDHRELLLRQISLIKPNIIIVCGTFGIIKDILFGKAKKIETCERSYDYNGSLLIDFLHPSRAYAESYEFLFNEIKKIKNYSDYLG